ncbi:hypothetical protein OR1_03166 [Geobacter sp. OR-1]|uniref:hypothetical protein n=1 Tax=Geobacter sp. OR-1 TaxID=1266765 RepID=UPI000541AB79|nr:hypothetical protein [Geobacter sp. OR-1]GAM10866.1 hypothetical protein OR1_03166 [Geobacter sp. OR-1]
MKKILAAAGLMSVALVAGCGSSGSGSASSSSVTPAGTTTVSGAVADGYLQNAQVFLDKNGNYQLDAGEPSTTTDQTGAYTLNIAPEDLGKYPVVAVAIKGQTIDMDNPGQTLQNSYVLCIPATATSGTVSNFISPMSTLLRAKLEANPGMTLADAMTQLRNQLGLPGGMNMLGDYVAGAKAGQYRAQYQAMHQAAQQMASLMADQAALVMNGTSVNAGRFRSMMGLMNQNLQQIADNSNQGLGMNSTFMNSMRGQMQGMLGVITTSTGGFGNYSGMFRNMTSQRYFWNYTGGRMHPRGGMM